MIVIYSNGEALIEVEKLIKKYGTSNPYLIAEKCDYDIITTDLTKNTWGQMVRSNRCCTIFVDEKLPEHLKKFIIAHELGHCRLHSGHSTPFYRNIDRTSISKKEKQANVFALKLLSADIEGVEYMTKFQVLDFLGLPYDFERFL